MYFVKYIIENLVNIIKHVVNNQSFGIVLKIFLRHLKAFHCLSEIFIAGLFSVCNCGHCSFFRLTKLCRVTSN